MRGVAGLLLGLVLAMGCTARNPAFRDPEPGTPEPADAEVPAPPADAFLPSDAAPPADASLLPDAAPALAPDVGADLSPDRAPDLTADLPPDLPADRAADASFNPAVGITGSYYNGMNLDSFQFSRLDREIDFAWANDPPDTRLVFTGFSVRWKGKIRPRYSESYTFSVHSSDGSRVWVDGQQVLDDWRAHNPRETAGTPIPLSANRLHDIQVDYFHLTGWSVVRIYWQSTTQSHEVVPGDRLQPM